MHANFKRASAFHGIRDGAGLCEHVLDERERGDADAAKADKEQCLKSIDLVVSAANATAEIKQKVDNLKRSIEQRDH